MLNTMPNTQGSVFNIQRYSLHDGPGIRTIVFFQGCPLRCLWCSNPESQPMNFQMLFQEKDCIGCRECMRPCGDGAITFGEDDFYPNIDRKKCISCLSCVEACPTKALHVSGSRMSVEEVMEEVLRDKAFYDKSGGGLTLSGGEALMQPEFAIALLDAARNQGIHTAIETTGYAQPEVFDRVTEHADMILFDFKQLDDGKHQQFTGVSNKLILRNLKAIISRQTPDLIVRIPVIPDFNHSPDEMAEMAEFLVEQGAKKVHLLPFHQMGENKYKMLGIDYEFGEYKALHEEDLIDHLKTFLSYGLDTEIM